MHWSGLSHRARVRNGRLQICRKIPVTRLDFPVLQRNFPDSLLREFAVAGRSDGARMPGLASASREIDTTKVSVEKHFGHSKVCESKPGLSGSMIRNDIVSLHFEQRGLLILSANTAPPLSALVRRLLRAEACKPLEGLCTNLMFGT